MSIPRVLYTYWEGPTNEVVELCIASMRKQNPGWTVVVATSATCEEICGRKCPMSPKMRSWHQYVADWFRLQCLAEHGGVWLDASCLCLKPLESWVDVSSPEKLQGFKAPIKRDGLLESWALACGPNCLFMKAWAEEFDRCARLGRSEYRRTLPSYAFPGEGASRYRLVYFTCHHAALKILHEHPEFPVEMRSSRFDGEPLGFTLSKLYFCLEDVRRGREPIVPHSFFKINGTTRRQILRLRSMILAKERGEEIEPS